MGFAVVFEVRRDDLHESRFADSEPAELEDGQALLRVESFGLTSNNITYAVFGDAMSYWDFFPAESGWGRMPVWGFADVAASRHDAVEEGTRVYGYFPPATELVVTPDRAGAAGFVDAAPHRGGLPPVYNGYQRIDADPSYDPEREATIILLRPLFVTSFLIDDFLDDAGHLDGAVAISSASSKTSLAAAFMLAERDGVEVIGLTSPGNTGFAERVGVYDRVTTYDSVSDLPSGAAAYVDVSGDGAVRSAVHEHYGNDLVHSAIVGATHWDRMAAGDSGELPGPAPTLFFAPDRISTRTSDWGREGLDSRVADAWRRYAEWTDGWLEVVEGRGPEAVERVYREVLDGEIDPATGHVLSMQEA